MAENTKIEWADHSWNPWIGCQHVSPGCDNCYAEAMNKRWKWSEHGEWGPHAERKLTSLANWNKPLKWANAARATGRRPRVFCASLADWLDNQAPQQYRINLAHLIQATPELDWLLLTKRIENFRRLSPWPVALDEGGQIPFPSNVWLGVTAEDQEHYDKRWAILQHIPATVRFISYEPALGPLDIAPAHFWYLPQWIICGGESGKGARWMDPSWARLLRSQCELLDIPFFFKQMTGKKPIPADLLVRQFPRMEGRPYEKTTRTP